jgi:predicted TIM-barrel fold metal-dependent hydrolase
LRPYARRLIDAFSPQRVMWASDYIPRRYAVSWAQSLRHMIAWQELSDDEAEWVFGRTVRTLLSWAG